MPSAELFLRKAATNAPIEFHLNKDLTQFRASCTEFGSIAIRETVPHHVVDPNKIVSIMDKSQYNVRTATDKKDCHITGIWESSNRELIIADFHNKSVKILNRAYNSIEKIQIPNFTCSICNISSNKTAIIVCIGNPDDEIDLLQVDKGKIVNFNTLPKFLPRVWGIAIYQDDIFVTSGENVSQYTMDGRLVEKLYEDKSTG
ncbi:hypothetical protein DPMN_146280 [Dreissena polymorpha]|uniref:Uncharacterized protein n=1 Tax=Dreissena polymorpha TaxID=45954 RepID=A0A9D4F7L7_DREPO|nr:hypothetical protein DPMN_146280 [Dreissena polymorpha]